MPFRRHLTVEEASRAIGLLQSGLSQRQVGERFNVSHSVISRLLARFQQTNSVKQRQKVPVQEKQLFAKTAKLSFWPNETVCHLQFLLIETSGQRQVCACLSKQLETDSMRQDYMLENLLYAHL